MFFHPRNLIFAKYKDCSDLRNQIIASSKVFITREISFFYFHHSHTVPIPFFIRIYLFKKVRNVVPFEHSESTKSIRHSKHLGPKGIWALKAPGHSSPGDTRTLKEHLGTRGMRGTLLSRLAKAISLY